MHLHFLAAAVAVFTLVVAQGTNLVKRANSLIPRGVVFHSVQSLASILQFPRLDVKVST